MFLVALIPVFTISLYNALHPKPSGPLTGAYETFAFIIYVPLILCIGIITTVLTKKSGHSRLYSLLGFLIPSGYLSMKALISLIYS
jgi:hypothetical protein